MQVRFIRCELRVLQTEKQRQPWVKKRAQSHKQVFTVTWLSTSWRIPRTVTAW